MCDALFTVLCPDQTVPILDKMTSCLTTLFWTRLWHAITLIANVWSLLEKKLLKNVENILTSACVSWSQSQRPQHRNKCQTFACMVFNGSVSNHDERTFHGIHYKCYVVYKCKLTPLNFCKKEQKKYSSCRLNNELVYMFVLLMQFRSCIIQYDHYCSH